MTESVIDLRVTVLGAVAWAGALAGFLLGPRAVVILVVVLGGWLLVRRHRRGRRRRSVSSGAACLLVFAAVAGVALLRVQGLGSDPVADFAMRGSYAEVVATVTSDPVVKQGRFARYTLTRITVTRVIVEGRSWRSHAPVLAFGDSGWARLRLGASITVGGRLGRSTDRELAGILTTHRTPRVRAPPSAVFGVAAAVRANIRAAVGSSGPQEQALVPALVDGDRAALSPEVVADFRTCGLTHLAAVSGTNLTLVVGFLLIVARWVGVRARGLTLVGALGVVGFVLLARPEPSVLRAAAMGSVALLGLGPRGADRGIRSLGTAIMVLLIFDPWLALSMGFALSTVATAGILFLAPPFRDALNRWLPRSVAEAIAVPFAAQLACTPLIAAISGQVSVVAVLANLAVAPAVGPATVLGLGGGLVFFVLPWAGHTLGWLAGRCGAWIITVATHLSALPNPAVGWPTDPWRLVLLSVACVVVALGSRHVLARPGRSAGVCLLLVCLLLRPLPTPGWPPRGWVLVACDVGQGDGLVLNAGRGGQVVVDSGPDPVKMAGCLRRLGVHRVPVVVLTHFHADHVDGLPAVLHGRSVGEIDVTGLRVPPEGAAAVEAWAATAGVPVRVPGYGETRRIGDLTWQVIGPAPSMPGTHGDQEGTVANNASLVLLVSVAGIRILMSGDMEPEAQAELHAILPGLRVDVLKVPHHGSAYQDRDLLDTLGARLAVISVGRDNDYGHPASSTLDLLQRAGMTVRRTDLDGDVAVVVHNGRVGVATRK